MDLLITSLPGYANVPIQLKKAPPNLVKYYYAQKLENTLKNEIVHTTQFLLIPIIVLR